MMLPVYLGVLLVVGYVWRAFHPGNFYDGPISFVGWFVFGGFLVGAACLGLSFVCYTDRDGEMQLTESSHIVALRDNPSVEGDFGFLGVGHIEGSMVYVWYTEEAPGVYQFHSVDAHKGEVHEVAGVEPYVERWHRHFKSAAGDHLLWQTVGRTQYKFYIPPGTLRQTMTLDLR